MKWYLATGPEGDVVISTRIRLARNFADVPFPPRMTPEQAKKVIADVKDALLGANASVAKDFDYFDMEALTPARAQSLAERHLISPEFAQQRRGRALLLAKDESVSIMVNEEDHLRIQTLLPGMQLKEAYGVADRFDDLFDEKLKYAFNENLGYLTTCPTNLGTGLRASVMLHLPAIAQSGAVPSLANTVAKLGLTIRGTYGEGSDAQGAFFQLSNQVTLGLNEAEAIENLHGIAGQIIGQERAARENLKKISPRFEDRVFRSYGLLRSARLLSHAEFMALISDVRLGVVAGLIPDVSLETVSGLISETQPATLQTAAGRNLDAAARDQLRAQKVREALAA